MESNKTGSREHGVKKVREQGAWENLLKSAQKINLGSREQWAYFWREPGAWDPPMQRLPCELSGENANFMWSSLWTTQQAFLCLWWTYGRTFSTSTTQTFRSTVGSVQYQIRSSLAELVNTLSASKNIWIRSLYRTRFRAVHSLSFMG